MAETVAQPSAALWAMFKGKAPAHCYVRAAPNVFAALCGGAHAAPGNLTPAISGRCCKRCERVLLKRDMRLSMERHGK